MCLQSAIFGYWLRYMKTTSHILYGVLNWGLGHATRSVPVIRALIDHGFTPVIASDGAALDYLRGVFKDLPFEKLPGYEVHYSKRAFVFNIVTQLPRIGKAVRSERSIAKELVAKYDAKGIVSDNRLGFYNHQVPSAFITHQLKIILPFPASLANAIHHNYINKFNACWVPDFEDEKYSLAGTLTHTNLPKIPTHYIGPLSQLRSISGQPDAYDAVAILSGPEPQRSILEEVLLKQMEKSKGRYFLVRGTSNVQPLHTAIPHTDLLTGPAIAELISKATLVISRSGYSSLMDYYFIGNKALLIPTPGQAEQEYLGDYLRQQQKFYSVNQNMIDLEDDMEKALKYPGFDGLKRKTTDWKSLFGLFEGKGKS